jgi:hypothetical protein
VLSRERTTGDARLMLAMLERCVTHRQGSYVFSDTDSMAIVATESGGLIACGGGHHPLPDGSPAVRALSYAEVDEILERFANLSPYDPSLIESILKIEDVNYNETANGYRCTPTASAQGRHGPPSVSLRPPSFARVSSHIQVKTRPRRAANTARPIAQHRSYRPRRGSPLAAWKCRKLAWASCSGVSPE